MSVKEYQDTQRKLKELQEKMEQLENDEEVKRLSRINEKYQELLKEFDIDENEFAEAVGLNIVKKKMYIIPKAKNGNDLILTGTITAKKEWKALREVAINDKDFNDYLGKSPQGGKSFGAGNIEVDPKDKKPKAKEVFELVKSKMENETFFKKYQTELAKV